MERRSQLSGCSVFTSVAYRYSEAASESLHLRPFRASPRMVDDGLWEQRLRVCERGLPCQLVELTASGDATLPGKTLGRRGLYKQARTLNGCARALELGLRGWCTELLGEECLDRAPSWPAPFQPWPRSCASAPRAPRHPLSHPDGRCLLVAHRLHHLDQRGDTLLRFSSSCPSIC